MRVVEKLISRVVSIGFLVFFIGGMNTLFSLDIHSLPIHSIEADKVRSETGKIYLEGSVKAVLDLGVVTCEKALLLLDKGAKEDKVVSRVIELENHVEIQFTDGGNLQAHKGVIDCVKRMGTFTASPEEKVIYETQLDEQDPNSIARATSNKLVGKLVRQEKGWKLDDLNAEGAVRIEYLPKTDKNKPETVSTAHSHE